MADGEVLALLSSLPDGLERLREALLTAGELGGQRPWLAPVPELTVERHRLWSSVVDAVAPYVVEDRIIPRMQALKVLALCPIPEAGLAALPGLSSKVHVTAALDAVARSGMSTARDVVLPLLAHRQGRVRFKAASALGLIGDPLAIPALQRLFETETEEPLVLRWAARSIGELGGAPERAFLQAQADLQTDRAVLDGIREGLADLGESDRDDLHPVPEVAGAARSALAGDSDAIDWLLDRYCDAAVGLPCRAALAHLPAASVLSRREGGPASRRFAAADLLAARRVPAALPWFRALTEDPELHLVFVGYLGLLRLGEAVDQAQLRERWLEWYSPQDRVDASREILWCEQPIPQPLIALLVDDPCGPVAPVAAELLRRAPSPQTEAMLVAALDLEWRRLDGSAPPRDPRHNDAFAMHASRRATLVEDGAAARGMIPEELRADAKELEREGFADPSVIAAHGFLHALTTCDPPVRRSQWLRWCASSSALLRYDALKWLAAAGEAFPASLATDPDARVRRFFDDLRG